ncbi:MAG TPA: efflux RND transporter periplasmic adaptor subunit [Polyangia bacterium]|nr:efflux RND transporter periplasmic adaptor subunit [Polyangia bacterium]
MRTTLMLIVSSLGLAPLAGCGAKSVAATKSATAVRLRAVERSAAANATRYSATINPATRVDLAFKVGGYVQRVASVRGVDGRARLLQEGDRVSAGQELASVRKADYEQKLAEAKAALAEALASKEQAQIDFDRATRLVGSDTVAKAELDTTRVRLDAANARADGARVRVAEAETALDDTRLRAPMDAVVVKRNVELGTLAAPGLPAISIADTQTVKVVFGVADTELEALRLGTRQTVTAEAFRGRDFEGRITRIAPIADPKSRVFEVEITIANPEGELKPGMIAALKLNEKGAAAPVAVLPLNAVVRSPGHAGRFAVYVVDQKSGAPIARLREVELGEFLGNQIPIRAGLADGDRVIVQGATLVSDGEAVQVIP